MTDNAYAHAVTTLQKFVEDLLPYWPVPGGAIVITDRDGIVANWGFGIADIERNIPSTTDHLYLIGSISKSFTALVINQLVDEGKLNLDDDITAILPWVQIGPDSTPTTIHQLLTHTAGLIMGDDGTPDDLVQTWALRNLPVAPDASQHWHYSNVGFMLLGQVVQEITGNLIADEISTRILEPLYMPSTRGSIANVDRADYAVGYWQSDDDLPWRQGSPISPSYWFEIDAGDGCVGSSSTDMAQYLRLMLSDGTVDGNQILKPETFQRFVTGHALDGEPLMEIRGGMKASSSKYGYGVNVETVDGYECVTHGGGMVGYATFFIADRTNGIGIAVLTNTNGDFPAAHAIARAGHQLFVEASGEREYPALPPASDAVVTHRDSNAPLANMAGTFINELGASMTVTLNGDTMSVATGEHNGTLEPTWTGRYVTDLPYFDRFRWDFVDDSWLIGPHTFAATQPAYPALDEASQALVGSYRHFTPWYPRLRIFQRGHSLYLACVSGIEAPQFDELLVRLDDTTWRLGEANWLPERIHLGPIINGQAAFVVRDGVSYSRTTFK